MLLRVTQLVVSYGRSEPREPLPLPLAQPQSALPSRRAVDGVSFELAAGETLGIVGESGSGKSSIVRALLRLIPAASGSIEFNGQNWLTLRGGALRSARAQMQLVMQHPHASLDPQMRVVECVAEPLLIWVARLPATHAPIGHTPPTAIRERVLQVLRTVGLGEQQLDQYPHELSGGQAQRVSIARALISAPALLVCDEPLSALDVSIKAQITNLLRELQRDAGRSMLLVSHELPAVRYLCQRVLVLFSGQVVEEAPTGQLFAHPRHPYTRSLLRPGPPAVESVAAPPAGGCAYRARCPLVIARCAAERPALQPVAGSLVACHRATEFVAD
jgi:oligopeptide/dipeptide ABC transporter ATP-binding protein